MFTYKKFIYFLFFCFGRGLIRKHAWEELYFWKYTVYISYYHALIHALIRYTGALAEQYIPDTNRGG